MKIVRALPYVTSAVCLILLLSGATDNKQTNVLRATRIELVDGNGTVRGYWSAAV